jgi:hypothetical protein
MRHAVAIFTIIALAAAVPAQAKPKERAPRFADYPVAKVSHMRVAKPKIPESWDEDPRLRFQDSVHDDSQANFAGHYFVAIWGCGSTCVWGGIVEAKSYVLENGKLRPLKTIKQGRNFMTPNR